MNFLRISLASLVIWTAVFAFGRGQSVRVAVAGDTSLANLVDVTTSDLSNLHELTVLDRADLDKLGQEQEIQSVLNSQDFSPVQVIPADGLVLLRAVTEKGKTGVFARLVAVQPGVVLREVALPDGDPLSQAQALEKEFAPYWPKLVAIQKGNITALSLLGLRFDVDAPERRDLERSFNILLASRLGAEPDTLVLERWRLNDALFEKSLAPKPAPFWTGSSLIDGGLRMKDGRVSVSLRLRPAKGAEVSIEDEDAPENLAALVERLAGKIRSGTPSAGTWKPADEASHFAELGKWCLDNRLPEEGAQALESALALGDHARTTYMEQVIAYAMLAYPDDLRVVNSGYNKVDAKIEPGTLPARLAAAARAALLSREYLKANGDFSSPKWTLEDPFDLSVPVLNNCLRTLRCAYEDGHQQDGNMAAARHEAQKLVAAMDELVAAKHPGETNFYHDCLIRYAGLWHEKPEETLAYYRKLLVPNPDGGGLRGNVFRDGIIPPFLDGEGTQVETAPWSLQSPWIVSWDGRSADDLKTLWGNFVKELAASPDPVLQADALKFEFFSNRTVEGRKDVLLRIVAFLKQHPENICGPRGEDFAEGFSRALGFASGSPACWNDILDLYVKLYHQHAVLPPSWIFATAVIIDPQAPTDAVKNLLAALTDYTAWYATQTPQDYRTLEALARVRQTIYDDKPELKPAPAPAVDALTVPQIWDNEDQLTLADGAKRPLNMNFRTLVNAEDKLWFLKSDEPHAVVCFDPAAGKIVENIPVPPQFEAAKHSPLDAHGRYIEITPQWIVLALAGQVLLCSRTDHQWHALDLPPTAYKPRWVNGELYLLYEADYGAVLSRFYANGVSTVGSGLIRVSLPDGKIEDMISSRRVPPQNSLDGKFVGHPLNLWMGPQGLTLAFSGDRPSFQVYASLIGKNDWTSVMTDPMPCGVEPASNGVLIGHRFSQVSFGEITFMNEKGSEVLLANPDEAATNGPVNPVWNFPVELRSSPPGVRSQNGYVMRGGDLCLCHTTRGDAGVADNAAGGMLYYFSRGQKEAVKIPLAFDVSKLKGPGSGAIGGPQSTDKNLVFCGSRGFWAVPWSDVDAARGKAQPASAAAR